MRKKTCVSRFVGVVFLLISLTVIITACGGQTIMISQGNASSHAVVNVDQVPSTPTVVALNIPSNSNPLQGTATSVSTPVPTSLSVKTQPINWGNPSTMYTVGYANLRSMPATSGSVIKTVAPAQAVTVYGTVAGEILSNGPTWYRVSDQNSSPQYIYSDLVTVNKPASVNDGTGKVIKVNLTTQHIYAYDNGVVVHDGLISSGQPGLLTPMGTFSIISKLSPTTFYSPWPQGSPYYYAPLHINYALGFQGTLLFLHDAYWRGNDFGPGTNVPHTAADGSQMTGSHGCVEMPTALAAWFYNWATIGTPLIISY